MAFDEPDTHLTKSEVQAFLKLGNWASSQAHRDDVSWKEKHKKLLAKKVKGRLMELDPEFDPRYSGVSYEEAVTAFRADLYTHMSNLPDPERMEPGLNKISDPPEV